MKVGTDSVLLGAWIDFSVVTSVLDVGTGCGILALSAAQQSNADIIAIDIDENACRQAADNFKKSKWSNRLSCYHQSLEEFAKASIIFDLVISNPPYFSNSLKSPNSLRSIARHTDELPISQLVNSAYELLNHGGKFSLIIPVDQRGLLDYEVSKKEFYLSRQMYIIPKAGKSANRVMIEYKKGIADQLIENMLVIRNKEGSYTDEYIKLTRKFYLNF